MAVRAVPSLVAFPESPDKPLVHPFRRVSGLRPDGAPEINLGAFRGLAFALIFQTVLFLLGGIAWEVFHALR
jgi:hypothetical protein